jgi:hypothetical protein
MVEVLKTYLLEHTGPWGVAAMRTILKLHVGVILNLMAMVEA